MEEIVIDGVVQPEFVGHARELRAFDVAMPDPFYQPIPPPPRPPEPKRTVIYQKRPLRADLTDTTLTFIEIMNIATKRISADWSFVGGFARDMYLGREWNDFDVCVPGIHRVRNELVEMGILELGHQVDMEVPHDYYINPYDFQKRKSPVHWIQAANADAYAPQDFDFSINQLALKADGSFYAPTFAWRDLDRGIIRRTAMRNSANIALRGIRFACRYGFTIEEEFNKEIVEFAKGPIDTVMFKRNLHKMIEDGVAEQALTVLKNYGFPRADECQTIEDYIAIQDQLILSGEGYREPVEMDRRYR